MQLITRLVLLCALVAAPAISSAIKGHPAREDLAKGQKSPAELHREAAKGRLVEQRVEQREDYQQQLITEQKLDKEEHLQQVEESPKQRYEAKPQVSRDDLAKGQQRLEETQRESKGRFEEQKAEETQRESKGRFESQKSSEERIEQQLKQEQYELPQLELKEEQRRYEDTPALVQPILPLTVVEDAPRQLPLAGTKGGAPAPLAEAEPYAFSYQVEGSSRSESGDTKGVVRGQYTIQGADGSSRVVDYVADHNGFRASVNTNEFGTEAKSPAGVALRSSQPNAEDITLRLEGKTREDLAPPAVKAPPAVPAKPDNWAVKAPEPVKPILEAPSKGQRLVQQQEELPIRQEAHLETEPQLPVKSLEQRAPKALAGELKVGQLRSGFESATAHRVYRAPAVIRPVGPPVRALAPPPLPVAVRQPVVTVSRTQLQRERYPPSPVHQGHRRYVHSEQPGNPRVSFYGSSNLDDEQPISGFEIPELS